jgi:hypothetical protein
MPQYQGVWTLEAQAQALTNQQWVTDPNFKNTTLLLQADGTGSGSQNQTFLDGSTNNFFITRNGNTTQGSFSPFSQAPGYWSNYFDGTDDDLSIASDVKLTPAAGDFTLECWIFPTSWASLGSFRSVIGGPVSGCMYFGQTSTGFGLRALAVADVVVTTTLPPTNAWTHVAVSRSGTSARLFINGALVSTATDSTNFAQTQVVIANTSVAGTEEYSGYISNLRFIKGTALYTSAFTPQTSPLTAVTNTQLLTCQSNRFVDNSANAFSLSVGGTPSVQAFGPFAPALQWTPDVVGGSGYFDGTGDYLNTPSSANLAMSTGDFTIECWVNTSLTGARYIFDIRPSGSQAIGAYISSSNLYVNSGSTLDILASSAFVLNAWNHFAYVRSGSGSNNVSIFLNGVRVYQRTDATDYSSNAIVYVGADNAGAYSNGGYISGFRILKGTAQYSGATITVPTAPVTAIANTQLLLNYTNAGIYDGKMGNVLETVGNAQVSTSPVKYGSGSMYFNGSASYLRSQVTSPLFAIGTTYTIEGWFYRLSNTSAGTYTSALELIGTQPFGSSTTGFLLTFGTSGGLYFYDGANSTVINYANATTLIPLNQWNHIAVVRAGGGSNNVTLFVNGIAVATGTSSSAQSTAQSFFIGGDTNGNGCFTGYIDDLRITRAARYFTNFTPPQQALPRQ